MNVLFIDNNQGYNINNPTANLISVSSTKEKIIEQIEIRLEDPEKNNWGWKEMLDNGNIKYKHISQNKISDYSKDDFDEYFVIIKVN